MKAFRLAGFAALAILSVGGCALNSPATSSAASPDLNPLLADNAGDLAAEGRQLVVRECAACHAIDQDTISPRAGAPAMKDILDRYDPDMLAADLIEGIRIGHDDMPRLDFDVIGADSLIAYLKAIARNDIQAR